MQQSLGRFVSPGAARTLAEVYNIISRAYVRRPGDEALTSLLSGVKKTLADARKGTRYEFLCFKPNKERSKDPKVGGTSTTGTRSGASTPTVAQAALGLGIPPVPSLSPASSAGRDSESVSGSMVSSGSRVQERPPRRRPAGAGSRAPDSVGRSSDTRL